MPWGLSGGEYGRSEGNSRVSDFRAVWSINENVTLGYSY